MYPGDVLSLPDELRKLAAFRPTRKDRTVVLGPIVAQGLRTRLRGRHSALQSTTAHGVEPAKTAPFAGT
jgi:hypothetical protein